MNKVIGDRILHISQFFYYTDLFLLLCEFTSIFISYKNIKRDKAALFFTYSLVAAVIFITGRFHYFISGGGSSHVIYREIGNVIFAVVEYSIFYFYYKKIITSVFFTAFSQVMLILIFTSSVIAIMLGVFGYFSKNQVYKFTDFLTSVELLCLAIICVCYFYELLKKKAIDTLISSPSFWITTTLFIYSIFVIPFFSISLKVVNTNENVYRIIYSAHYIAFSLLFVGIVKAVLCKRPLTD